MLWRWLLAHGLEASFFPGAVGLIVGGPIGLAAGATFGGIMAYEYEKYMWKKILEIVKRESKSSANCIIPGSNSIGYAEECVNSLLSVFIFI
jgi:hypothetical protein